MNKKRTLFYLLFGFVIVIFLYNYVISPALIQNSNNSRITMNIRMGMGMHMGMEKGYNNTNYNNSNISSYIEGIYFIVLAILTLISSAIIYTLFLKNKYNSCSKCGYKIEDGKWRKCPECGNSLYEKRNGK